MRRTTIFTSGLIAVLLVAGCTDSGFDYVKNSDDRTYFKVPDQWTLYDEDEIVESLGAELTESQRSAELKEAWQVAFDADPKPSIKHIRKGARSHPFGFAHVRALDGDVADVTSMQSLRNYFIDLDTALENDQAELVEYDDLQLEGGFRGLHLVADVVDSSGEVVTFDQTILVDQATSKVYALVLRCSDTCYEDNADDIETVVDSWTVRAK